MRIQIITCSVREGRLGARIADWTADIAREMERFEVEQIDLRQVALPPSDEPKHPRLGDYKHEHTKQWSATISRGDGYVLVLPEYNHSFPATIKNAIDYLHREWKYKPVGFVSYGGISAGTRAVLALKPVLSALQMVPLVESVSIPAVQSLFDSHQFRPPAGLKETARVMFERLSVFAAHQAPLVSGNA